MSLFAPPEARFSSCDSCWGQNDDAFEIAGAKNCSKFPTTASIWDAVSAGGVQRCLLMVYAPWCSACQAKKDRVVNYTKSAHAQGTRVALVNGSVNTAIMNELGIKRYPTFVMYDYRTGERKLIKRFSDLEPH